ncbi:zinc finger protein ZFAT-like [Ptychodera flava]|uniref:zinc finger protein ZFAT-like n=1 Tax=Ptychodera flava TaxID=63121 RepID=UPI003969DA90
MDTFTCGNCQVQFTDIELFMTHKKSNCESTTVASITTVPTSQVPANDVTLDATNTDTIAIEATTPNTTNIAIPEATPSTNNITIPAATVALLPTPLEAVVTTQSDQSTDVIIFVCKQCNQFSPTRDQLIEHVRSSHDIHEGFESLISTLQALPGSSTPIKLPILPSIQKITTAPLGRRRGRPRKVPKTEEELKAEEEKRKEEEKKKEEIRRLEETMHDNTDGFDCSQCKRKFKKIRQLKHHRCVPEYFEEDQPAKRPRGRPSLLKKIDSSYGSQEDDQTTTGEGTTSVQPSLTVFDGTKEANVHIPQENTENGEGGEDSTSGKGKRDKRSRMSYLEKYVVGEITEHCIQQTINQGSAVPHRSNTTNPVLRVFTCPHCNKLFKYRHALAVHILIHKDIKPFKCQLCDYASNSSGNLNVHMRKHTGEKFKCDQCDFTCINKGHLKVHKAKHGTIRYECELCGKKVHHPTELLKHIKYKHDVDKDPHAKEFYERKKMDSRSGRRALLYQCNICERKFKTKRDHDIHLYLHTNEKPHKCDLCDYTTARKPYIKAHVKKHKIVYVCFFCDEKFLSSIKLTNHLQQTHSALPDFDIQNALSNSINISLYLIDPANKDALADEAIALNVMQQESANSSQTDVDFQATGQKEENGEFQGSVAEAKEDAAENKETQTTVMGVINGLSYQHLNAVLLSKLKEIFGNYECEECGKLFMAKVEYEKHVVIHTSEKSLKCQQCDYATHHADGLKRHMESVHSGIKYKCAECGLETASKYYLKIHMKKHIDGKHFNCSLCDYSTTEESDIRNHISDIHPEMTASDLEVIMGGKARLKSKIGRRPYKCPYCGKLFHRGSADLKRHIWAHKGITPFRCQLCGHGTRSKSNLKAHMMKHSDAKNHLCDECGKSFKTKNSLQVHQLGHKNEKKYQCPYCEYTALQPSHLKRHLETHGGLKPFKCGLCVDYSSNNKGTLRSHYRKKHPNEPFKEDQIQEIHDAKDNAELVSYPCSQCEYVFTNKWDLRTHMKKKHKIDADIVAQVGQQQPIAVSVDLISSTGAEAPTSPQQEVIAVTQPPLQDVDQNIQYTDASQIQLQQTDRNAVNILQQIMGMQDLATVTTVVSQDGTVTSDAVTYATTTIPQQTLVATSEGQTYVAVAPDSQGLVAVAPDSVVIQQTPDAVSEQVVGDTTSEENKNSYVVLLTHPQEN